MLVSPQGYEAGRGNESAPLVNKQNNASGWAISSNRSCCRGDWFAVMSGDQRAGFLTEDVYPSAITSPLKTTYCMKCLFEKKKKTLSHISVSTYIYCKVHHTTCQISTLACDSHTSVYFFFLPHCAVHLTVYRLSALYRLLRAHFSYLLARAIIGLQLGEDPMSLLQHGADLVPHGCLCLCGLGIWEGRKEGK